MTENKSAPKEGELLPCPCGSRTQPHRSSSNRLDGFLKATIECGNFCGFRVEKWMDLDRSKETPEAMTRHGQILQHSVDVAWNTRAPVVDNGDLMASQECNLNRLRDPIHVIKSELSRIHRNGFQEGSPKAVEDMWSCINKIAEFVNKHTDDGKKGKGFVLSKPVERPDLLKEARDLFNWLSLFLPHHHEQMPSHKVTDMVAKLDAAIAKTEREEV